jgi:hypothetical protein
MTVSAMRYSSKAGGHKLDLGPAQKALFKHL